MGDTTSKITKLWKRRGSEDEEPGNGSDCDSEESEEVDANFDDIAYIGSAAERAVDLDILLVGATNAYLAHGRVAGAYLGDNGSICFDVAPPPPLPVPESSRYEEVIANLYGNEILTRRQAGKLTQICCCEKPAGIASGSPLAPDADPADVFSTVRFVVRLLHAELGDDLDGWEGMVPLFEFAFKHEDVLKQQIVWARDASCRRYADEHTGIVVLPNSLAEVLPDEILREISRLVGP